MHFLRMFGQITADPPGGLPEKPVIRIDRYQSAADLVHEDRQLLLLDKEGRLRPRIGPIVKEGTDLSIFASDLWSTDKNNGNTFEPGEWYYVHDDIFNPDNWTYRGKW